MEAESLEVIDRLKQQVASTMASLRTCRQEGSSSKKKKAGGGAKAALQQDDDDEEGRNEAQVRQAGRQGWSFMPC